MTSRLHLCSTAASNLPPLNTLYDHHVIIGRSPEAGIPERISLAGWYGQDLGKRTAISAHRHEPLHQQTSRRHTIERAAGAVTRVACSPMGLPFHYHGQTKALAVAVRGALPRNIGLRRGWNRIPGKIHTFCTTVSQKNPVPRGIPSSIPAKPKVLVDRAASLMRGRGVPISRQDLIVEAEEKRKIKEAEVEKERKTRDEEQYRLEQIRDRLLQEEKSEEMRLKKIWEARLQQIRIAHEEKEKRFESIRRSMAQWDSLMSHIVWLVTELRLHAPLHAELVRVEGNSHKIALAILHDILGTKTSSALPLCNLLDVLNEKRERRWTETIETMVEQKQKGQVQDKLNSVTNKSKANVMGLIRLIDNFLEDKLSPRKYGDMYGMLTSQGRRSKSLVSLLHLRETLRLSNFSSESHDFRSWNRAALRDELAPGIFDYEVRVMLLEEKFSLSIKCAREITLIIVSMARRYAFIRINFVDERIRVLGDLIFSKAKDVRELGGYISTSTYRSPLHNFAHDLPRTHRRAFIEAELARVALPILRLALYGAEEVIDAADGILMQNMSLYTGYQVRDGLEHFRPKTLDIISQLSSLRRGIHASISELVYWRATQVQYQSQWGQASLPRLSHQTRAGISGSVHTVPMPLPFLTHTPVEQPQNYLSNDHKLPNLAPDVSIAISYVTTMTSAHTVLEQFRSSSLLGMEIMSLPRPDRIPSTSHRSDIQVLVLATEDHIAIFHFALFEGWDPLLLHIPALKEILESRHVLKVGVNMARHIECLETHTTIDMGNFVDLNEYAVVRMGGNMGDRTQSDRLSDLTLMYLNTKLPSLSRPGNITDFGLIDPTYIQFFASRPFAALTLYNLLQRSVSAQGPTDSSLPGPLIRGPFHILARPVREVIIDPHWDMLILEGRPWELARLKVRAKFFSRVARSRKICLTKIVESLANNHLPIQTMQQRRRTKAMTDIRRQDLQAMYLQILFHERPQDVLGGQIPSYSARQVLQIAKQNEIDIPPDRKAQLDAEVPLLYRSVLDPRDRAKKWLDSILQSGNSEICIARPSKIRSERRRLEHQYRHDVLLIFAVWNTTPLNYAEIASWFFITAEQVKSDILLIVSLKLLRHVEHKLEHLLADNKPTSPESSHPNLPPFKKASRKSSSAQGLATSTAGNKSTRVRLLFSKQVNGKERWPTSAGPNRQKRADVATVRVKRLEREREERKPPKVTRETALKDSKAANALALVAASSKRAGSRQVMPSHIHRRLALRETEAQRGISLGDSPIPLNHVERRAIKFGGSLRFPFAHKKAAKRKARGRSPPFNDKGPSRARHAENSTRSQTSEEKALRNANSRYQYQLRDETNVKARQSSKSGRRTSVRKRRATGKPVTPQRKVESEGTDFSIGEWEDGHRGFRILQEI